MQYWFSKQNIQQRNTPLDQIKAAFAWVKLPSQGNKHSYNLCARLGSTAHGPVWSHRPRSWEPSPQSFCSPRALLICFYRKHERYSFTGKFTIWSFESIGGPGSEDKRKTDKGHSDTSDTGSKSSHKTWLTFVLIRLFTITRRTLTNNHNYRATAEARRFPSKSLTFLTHEIWKQTFLAIISVKCTHSPTHTSHSHTNSGLNSVLWVFLRLAYIDIWDLD